MAIYIVLLGYIMLCAGLFNNLRGEKEKKNKYFLVLASCGIVFVSGFRSLTVGPDSRPYASHFYNIAHGIWLNGYERFEQGYTEYVRLLTKISDNYAFLFMVSAIIVTVCIGIFIYRYSKNYLLSIIYYITFGNFSFQLTGIRQSIAMGIALLSLKFVRERRIFWFLAIIAIAVLFHKSALFLIPIYFIANLKIGWKSILSIIIGTVTVIYANEFISNTTNELMGTSFGLGNPRGGEVVIAILSIALVASFIHKDRIQTDKNELMLFNMAIIAFITYIMRYWMQAAERVSRHYQFALIILLANFIANIQDKRTRIMLSILSIALGVILFVYRMSRDGSLYVYEFFW